MSDLYTEIRDSVTTIIDRTRSLTADGKLTFSEVFKLVALTISELVQLVEFMAGENTTGEEKKQAVLKAIDRFYDEAIAPLDIRQIPNVFEPAVDRALKQLLLIVADGWIDAIVSVLDRAGWGIGRNNDEPAEPDVPDEPAEPQGPGSPEGFEPY